MDPSSIERGDGDGSRQGPVPQDRPTGGGDGCRWHAPSRQALPSGIATKRVPCSDFTRINTVRRPAALASFIALRTSAGALTTLPATSRITSPVLKPWAAAAPSGSTLVTTTPWLPEPPTLDAGASERPR